MKTQQRSWLFKTINNLCNVHQYVTSRICSQHTGVYLVKSSMLYLSNIYIKTLSTKIRVDKEHKLHTNCTKTISVILPVSGDLVANHLFYILIFIWDVSALTYTANPSSWNCHLVCVKCSGVLHALSVQSHSSSCYIPGDMWWWKVMWLVY